MGKLILPIILLSVKQNLSHVWFLGPYTLGKLILPIILLNVKQDLSYVWFIRPPALGKLTLKDIHSFYLSIK